MTRAALILSAAGAIAGCGPMTTHGGECINAKTGEHVRVISDTGMWIDAVDSQGFTFSFRNTSQEWRCKVTA